MDGEFIESSSTIAMHPGHASHPIGAKPTAQHHQQAQQHGHSSSPGGSLHGHQSSSSGGASSGGHHSGAPPSASTTRYLCALYGLIRYEIGGSSVVGGPPAPVAAIAKLCALLRAMCHSDGQRLVNGRQAIPIMEATASATSTKIAAPMAVPPTPHSPFIGGGHPTAAAAAHATTMTAAKSAATSATSGVSFPSLPTFAQTSLTLNDALASTVSLHGLPATNPQLAQDLVYLHEREKRLAPITHLVASPGAAAWSLLLPTRFTRFVRVYKSTAVLPPGSPPIEAELQAWREVELPTTAGIGVHYAPSGAAGGSSSASNTSGVSSGTSSGGSHEQWRLSYLGKALLPNKSLVHVRPLRVTPVSTNYTAFLEQNPTAAYEREYEYVQEGFRFEDRDGIEVLIYQVLKVSTLGSIASSSLIRGNRWLCEVRSICLEDSLQSQQIKVQSYAKAMDQHVRFTKFTPPADL